MDCINETVVVFIMWIDYCFDASNSLWERDPTTACLHCISTVDVDMEFKDVVENVSTVSVVTLIEALPLNR